MGKYLRVLWEDKFILVALVLLFIATFVLVSCGVTSQPTFVKSGIVRDTIYSIEHRGNGVVVLWMTHSENDGFCFPQADQVKQAESIIREHNGEVLIDYQGQPSGFDSPHDPGGLCKITEYSNTYTIYVGYSLTPVKSR